MMEPIYDVYAEYMHAKGMLHDPNLAGDPSQEAYQRCDDAFEKLMLTPATMPWGVQRKFEIFQTEVIDADDQGRRRDKRELYGSPP